MWELKFDDGADVELGSQILDDKGRPGIVSTVKFFKSGAILVGCENGLQVKRDKGDLRPIRKPDSMEKLLRDISFCIKHDYSSFYAPCMYFTGVDCTSAKCENCRATKIHVVFKRGEDEISGSCVQKMLADIKDRIAMHILA